MKTLKLSAIVISIWLSTFNVLARQPSSTPAQNPDNTQTNQRDDSKNEPTADQQKENDNDRELTRKIRRSVVSDKSLSTYAHNVKIITQNGMVTLRGPVRSDDEKRAVEGKAAEAAGGPDHVKSEIEVKPSRNNSQ
jgi:hyperosmotically inducible protein